jgi:zinc protease
LWEELRNVQKLVHYIDCRNWNPGSSGLFWISYVCAPEQGAQVEAAVLEVIARVVEEGLPESMADKARRQSISAEINGRKTMSGQASRLGIGEVVIGDIEYTRRYLSRLQSVRAKDMQRVAATYLVRDGMTAVTLGPKSDTSDGIDLVAARESLAAVQPLELSGGLRLLLQQDYRLPKVHFRCVLLGGGLYEPRQQRGVSAIAAELLTKDTQKRTAAEIAELIESIGGSMTASGGNNTINLSIEVLPSDVDVALDLLADALLNPAFEADTVQTELDAQIAGLKEEDDDILEYGFRKLREHFFGEHPFAVGADGRVADLEQLNVDAIRQHYQRLVVGSNIVISVCGAFDREHVETQLHETIAAKLPQGSFRRSELAAYTGRESMDIVEHMDREQAVVLQAYPDVGILDNDFVTGEMLNELFSGMSSRLFERVREDKGLAYYVGSSRVLGLHTSMFVLYAGTHPDQIDEVVKEMNGELARVAAGDVLEDEVQRCRIRLKAARPMGRQTIGARAMHAAINTIYGMPLDDDAEYAAKLEACDATKLAAFTKRLLCPERRVQLVVRPDLSEE